MTQRTIKFRGKSLNTGEWIIGDLLHDFWIQGDHFIKTAIRYKINGEYYSFPIEVDPSTVGQTTGVLDKSGKEIWEGDIIRVDEVDTGFPSTGKPRIIQSFEKAVVTWDNRMLTYAYNPIRPNGEYKNYAHQMLGYGENIEVVSTIHDTDHGK